MTAPAPSVDIVINNYNYGTFVADAVESALAQTYPHVHVIVVDDGSTDGSGELLARYEGRIELLLKENGGQASALNAGAVRANGEIIMFLDADDALLPGAATLVASAFVAHPRAAKVQYRMAVIDEQGTPTGLVKPFPHMPLPSGDLRRAELTFPFDLVWLPNGASAFRASALRRILPIPERSFAECPDWYLVHLTTLLGDVVSLDEVGAYYRVHGRNRYEQHDSRLHLGHVRQAVVYAAETTRALGRLADDLGVERPYQRILSVADLANRLVSLKFEAARHPIASDRVWHLAFDGARAAARRFDVSVAMKVLYAGWFIVTAAAPAQLARPLAELFLSPKRRPTMNRVLQRLHRWNQPGSTNAEAQS
jgi:glycosyltransferase involved in cell wall biosynthesis